MSKYVLIESRDPFDSRDCEWLYDTAQRLTQSGNEVTVFLVQNGVLQTRKGSHYTASISELAQSDVKLLADSLSLKERAITEDKLISDVQSSTIDELVDLIMEDNVKSFWH
jgi:sulfur transfer complex TusBCD TusB component (DsrH family)